MPDQNTPTEQPVRITDKREERRREAELARLTREAEIERSKAEHPSVAVEEMTGPLEDDTALNDAIARVDRIQELRDKHGREGGLTEDEGHELLRLQAEQEEADRAGEQDGIQAMTAFVVVIGHDGSAKASHDLNRLIYIDREATTDDMYSGASIVVRDIQAALASKHVIFGMNVTAQAMQEKAMAVRTAEMLARQPSGRRRP